MLANYDLAKMTDSKPKLVEAGQLRRRSGGHYGAHADQAYRNAVQMKAEADRMR